MDFLTVITPEGTSTRRDLDGETLRIGRASGNDLVLQDLNASRNHAAVVRRTEAVYIVDAGGKNGTYVNDQRITDPVRLGAGDRVRLGSTVLVFNGRVPSNVEFSDRPLLQGAGTTFLPASGLRTPDIQDLPLVIDAATPAPIRSGSLASGSAAAIIQEANEELVFHRPLPEILETIMDLARRAVPFERGLLMLLEGER